MRKTWGIWSRIVLGTIASIGVIVLFLGLMEQMRSGQWFGWSWGPKPDDKLLALRGVVLNALQMSLFFFLSLFKGFDMMTGLLKQRLIYAYTYLLTISYAAAVLDFFQPEAVTTVEAVIGLSGLIGLPITVYAFVAVIQVYQNIQTRLRGEQELADRYYRQLITEPVTGLPNRLLLQEHLEAARRRAEEHTAGLAVLYIDLDRFKNVNDTLGHRAGDLLLGAVVERLQQVLGGGDRLYSLGGDEFVVLAECVKNHEGAERLAQRVLNSLAAAFRLDHHELFITASIGIACYPEDGESADALLKNADLAMYRAKEQGRNTSQLFDTKMKERALERLALEQDLRRAIEREQFVLYYQPQVELRTGRIVGMEALVRWQDETRGLVSPGVFIPLAEETRLIVPLGELVLRTACRQNQAWQAAGYEPMIVSVNLSGHQFAQPNLAEMVREILQETGLAPEYLELEITESITMADVDRAVSMMHELASIGVRISIDDFGTGYSSLSYLKKFPIHTLKIDRSFVRDIPGNKDDAAIATAIIAMAHSLQLNVIAEGVETEEQLAFLRERECDEMQGYLFSKPLPAAEFTALLQRTLV